MVEKAMSALFDQLSVHNGINVDACCRMGPYNKYKTRPILVTSNLIYAKKLELKCTNEFQQVWFNEDMGPTSKRKPSLIRLISREAPNQDVDCRIGKHSLQHRGQEV